MQRDACPQARGKKAQEGRSRRAVETEAGMSKPAATRLDWLSFTIEIPPGGRGVAGRQLPDDVNRFMVSVFGPAMDMGECKPEHGRFPYHLSTSGNGIRVFWTLGTFELLVEIEGHGCERLEAAGELRRIVATVIDDLTRVDIATDIETDTDPRAFVDARTNKRHKSHETSVSGTGITCYIGSRHSDRFARVYRYAPPHPRADRLRVEMVYRGHQAIALARTWLECGNDETAARAGNQYGWSHDDWTPKSGEKIQAWRPDRKTHKKLLWFYTQIKPAVRAMLAQGLLTPDELIEALLGPSQSQEDPI